MDELADSSDLVRDPEALRGRLAADGYLFFRGLLPAGQVRAAGSAVLARLHRGGWAAADGTVSDRRPAGAVPVLPRTPELAALAAAARGGALTADHVSRGRGRSWPPSAG